MTLEKIRRSERYKRTQPPRLVHAVQRKVQLSVTGPVMQITKVDAFISPLDISPPHMTHAAFASEHPLVASEGPVGARPGGLGQPRTHSAPGGPALLRAGRRDRLGAGPAHGTGPRWRGPVVILRAGWGRGVQVGSIVMALSPPRYLQGRHSAGRSRTGPRRARPGGRRRPPGARCRIGHQFQFRISHPFPLSVVAIPRKRPADHQFQLRTARSLPVGVFTGDTASLTGSGCARRTPLWSSSRVTSGLDRPRPHVRAAQERAKNDLVGCGRTFRRVLPTPPRRRARGVRPSVESAMRGTVID
jgi:hypothetical protein